MSDSRATATEFLDRSDCDPALAAASYRFMETVNGRFGGIRIVRRFLVHTACFGPKLGHRLMVGQTLGEIACAQTTNQSRSRCVSGSQDPGASDVRRVFYFWLFGRIRG